MEIVNMPRRITEGVTMQEIGAETLVYDARRHLAFCLNPVCSVVWKLIDGLRTVAQIRTAAQAQLDAEVSEELVLFTLQTLSADGLLEPLGVDAAATSSRPGISRRAMLQRLGAGGAMLLPLITSIVAPTAAQAYNGCVDCSTSNSRAARIRRLQQSSNGN